MVKPEITLSETRLVEILEKTCGKSDYKVVIESNSVSRGMSKNNAL